MQRLAEWALLTLCRSAWAPIGVFVVHVIALKVLSVYEWWPSFDIPMHLVGGAAIAYFLHTASVQGSASRILGGWHRGTHILLVFGWTAVAAIFWEFAEFSYDRLLESGMQYGDLTDTLKDILLGLTGGTALIVTVCAFGQAPSAQEVAEQPEDSLG
jgi:hypothetical protein